MLWYQIPVAGRLSVEALLNLTGLLNVRDVLRRAGPKPRIAFQAYAKHLALCFAPIIDALRRDVPDIEIHFIVLPHPQFTLESLIDLRDFVRDTLGVPADNIRFFWQAVWHRYDLLICTDVYARFPMRRPKTVLLKHGAGVASRALKRHWFRKTITDFDLVLVNGEADRELLSTHGPGTVVLEKVFAVGLPYLDRLQTYPEPRESYLRRLGVAPDRKVAWVGPSWRGLQAIQSRDPRYFDDLIRTLQALGWEVLIKMHTCSFNRAMVQGEAWAAKLRQYADSNVHIDYDVDDVPALLHADILITDISSRAFDFMLLDKPVIAVIPRDLFTDQLDVERIELLRRGARLIESTAELGPAIAQELNDGESARTERQRVARRVFSNPGRATEVVVGHLLRQLKTETLEPQRQ
jgi:hypothetical protein